MQLWIFRKLVMPKVRCSIPFFYLYYGWQDNKLNKNKIDEQPPHYPGLSVYSNETTVMPMI